MLPLGILNASTMNVFNTRKSPMEIVRILSQSQRNPKVSRRRLTCCNASSLRSGVIIRDGTGDGSGLADMDTPQLTPGSEGQQAHPGQGRPTQSGVPR